MVPSIITKVDDGGGNGNGNGNGNGVAVEPADDGLSREDHRTLTDAPFRTGTHDLDFFADVSRSFSSPSYSRSFPPPPSALSQLQQALRPTTSLDEHGHPELLVNPDDHQSHPSLPPFQSGAGDEIGHAWADGDGGAAPPRFAPPAVPLPPQPQMPYRAQPAGGGHGHPRRRVQPGTHDFDFFAVGDVSRSFSLPAYSPSISHPSFPFALSHQQQAHHSNNSLDDHDRPEFPAIPDLPVNPEFQSVDYLSPSNPDDRQSQIGYAWADGDGGAAPSRFVPPAVPLPPQPQMPYRSQRVAAMAIQGAEHSQGTHDFDFFAVGDVSRSQSQIGYAWADGDGGAAPSRFAPPAAPLPPQPQMPHRSQRVAAMAEHSQGTHDFDFFAVGDVSRSQSQIGYAWADGDGGAAPSRFAPPAVLPQPQMPYRRQRVAGAAKAIQGAEHSQHPAAMAMQDSPLHVVPLGTAPDAPPAAKPPPPRRGRGRPKGLAWRTPSEQPEPTPEELIGFLRSKYGDDKLAVDGVKEFNVYEAHPNTIIEKLGTNADKTWYVFSPRRRRNARYDRPWAGRSAGAVGHWRVQKVATPVHGADGEVIGMTSTFAFFLGKTKRESVRTPWKMKEYYITEEHGKPIPNSDDSNKLPDEWVICRVSCTRKKSDAQAEAGPGNMGDQSGEVAGHVDKTNGDSVPWAGHLKNRLLTSDIDASASEDNLPQKDGDQSGEAAGRVNETNAGQDKFADDDEINEWLQCMSTL